MADSSLITVGFCPAWDITCRADDIDWGRHIKVAQAAVPAGKALNVSKALAWQGQKSIADGAIAIMRDQTVICHIKSPTHTVVNTVACGDYLLAGFLAVQTSDLSTRLQNAVAVATAHAWALTGIADWPTARQQIKLETIVF